MEWWLGYLAIGAFVGFFAGLLGIGGGAVIVPLLATLFEAQGFPREQLLHLAVGTSMATILLTSLSSVRAHARRGAVRWDVARGLTPGIVAGGLSGSAAAGAISTPLLACAFTVIVYIAGTNILLDRQPKPGRTLPSKFGLFLAGFIISGVSSLVALGGAFMSVPFMIWCNVDVRHAIGTAAFIGFPIALVGTLGYVATGWGAAALPPWSLGYVHLPAMAGVCAASIVLAPLGAKVSHRTPTKILKRVFGVLLLAFATRMLIRLI
jgi:uncharacterized membrane protein YfcA